ncbi:transposase [Streptococcus pneumoniae]|nr:transposase [Streptococcus pneumoniae]
MSRVRVQIMNQLDRKSHEYKAIKRYWKLIQQDSRKLSDKRFYRPTFRMHLTNKEILNKLLSYSQDLKHHYQLYQLLLFHFQNKEPEKFFGLIEDNLKKNHQIPRIINQKIAQKLIEKISMTDIAHQLSISTSTVIRKLNDFHFECNFRNLPEIMSWDVETVRGVTVSIGRWR